MKGQIFLALSMGTTHNHTNEYMAMMEDGCLGLYSVSWQNKYNILFLAQFFVFHMTDDIWLVVRS